MSIGTPDVRRGLVECLPGRSGRPVVAVRIRRSAPGGGPSTLPAMATPRPGLDPRAVIEGRPPGRPRPGLVVGIAAGMEGALVVLVCGLLQWLCSATHRGMAFPSAVL